MIPRKLAPTALAAIVLAGVAVRAHAQTAPGDFDLRATAGALSPRHDNVSVHITAAGQGTYLRYRPDSLATTVLDSLAFTLTGAQVNRLWQTITNNAFFSLNPGYSDPNVADRTFASLTIRGNAVTAMVTTTNIGLGAFDAIVDSVNALTPGTRDLVYDTSTLPTWVPQDGCGGTTPMAPPALLARAGVDALRAGLGGFDSNAALAKLAALARQGGPARPGRTTLDPPEVGVTVAYHISLAEALSRGIATLSSKGGYSGDVVSLTVDNTSGVTTNKLTLEFNLDVFGSDAINGNPAAMAADIKAKWGGWFSNGVPMDVTVNANVVPGPNPPANAGYDQIILSDPNGNPPVGINATTRNASVNSGVAIGAWNVNTHEYAHEAGHLMGLPDRYTDYRKQGDGSWQPVGGGPSVSANQLATLLGPSYPNLTQAQILAQLAQLGRATLPDPGHEDDIMARSDRLPIQSDIDAIAAQAGLVVDIPPGNVLVNKDGSQQNLVTVRSVRMFVPKGQVRTIAGLWTECIDLSRHSPDFGTGFDLAPPISAWTGIPAAAAMQKLLDYADRTALYCNPLAQAAVWDISENSRAVSPADSELFVAAGVALPLPTGFPHLNNPRAGNPATGNVVPRELLAPTLLLNTPNVVSPQNSVGLTAAVALGPAYVSATSAHWTLVTPPGSAATLSSANGLTSGFRPDLHGTYQVGMHANVTTATDTFVVDTSAAVMCADAYCETFESYLLNPGPPFHWVSAGDSAWTPLGYGHTGSYCIIAPFFTWTPSSRLSTTITLSAPGTLEFAYAVISAAASAGMPESAGVMRLLVDGAVVATYPPTSTWQLERRTIAGGTHTLAWTVTQQAVSEITFGALDDIAFPLTAQLAGVEPGAARPPVALLAPCRPNPVRTTAVIPFTLPRAAHVRLSVFDLLGREVVRLADADYAAGAHERTLDASRLPPGLYTIRIVAGDFRATRTMVRLR